MYMSMNDAMAIHAARPAKDAAASTGVTWKRSRAVDTAVHSSPRMRRRTRLVLTSAQSVKELLMLSADLVEQTPYA